MGYYKIINITNTLGKREPNYNTNLKIEFSNKFTTNTINLNSGKEIIIECNYLPISIQKLRTEGLLNVIDIDKNTYLKYLNNQNLKTEKKVMNIETKSTESDFDSEEKSKKYKKK
jgi:hypothetical protein